MVEVEELAEPFQVTVQTLPAIEMDDEQFFQFCAQNSELQIERTAEGEIILMSPEGGASSSGNFELGAQFATWVKPDGTGRAFGPSAGFILSNKAMRGPDLAWVTKERLRKCGKKAWKRFLPLCPDFVLELRSESDSLPKLKMKMDEYIANGARLAWLIDPLSRKIFIYRPGQPVEALDDPKQLSGETVLPGFVLEMVDFWAAWEGEN